jgi:hypothetical protein
MARVPLTRNSTGQFARVAQLVAGSNVTISESLTGEVLTVTVAASGGGGGGGTPASSVVSETTFGLSPVVGTSTDYARGDHSHGTPTVPLASSVVSETAFGQSSAIGTSTNVARQDHTHGTPAVPAHSALSTLGWTSSGHTGSTTSVAAFNGGGAAQVVQATADETMLVRRGGTLQWVAIVAAIGFLNDPETDEDFLYDSISTQSAEVAPGVIS